MILKIFSLILIISKYIPGSNANQNKQYRICPRSINVMGQVTLILI